MKKKEKQEKNFNNLDKESIIFINDNSIFK